nr:MAG TPA: hypothetical protein [Caudoviricetes sp.]DAW73513.1 MAG TPA: hypothetical protein [Caudoviricetes sp.]
MNYHHFTFSQCSIRISSKLIYPTIISFRRNGKWIGSCSHNEISFSPFW